MSRLAKAALITSIVVSSLTIWAVHYQQVQERDAMYQGVLRDDERRREKMRQRQNDLLQSHQKRDIYERVQTVSSEGDPREEGA